MAYTPEDSWREFETTGSVTAYLAYRKKSTKTPDAADEPPQPRGNTEENS